MKLDTYIVGYKCLFSYLMPLFGVDIIELSRRQNLIIISQTSSDQDSSTGLQLNIETSMITPASTVI